MNSKPDMLICIPSIARADNQITLKSLLWCDHPIMIVTAPKYWKEYEKLQSSQVKLAVCEEHIAGTRNFIIDYAYDMGFKKVMMLDDDLLFYKRRSETDWHLRYLELSGPTFEMKDLVNCVSKKLDEYAHVGISAREGNNRSEELWQETTRMMRAIAFDVSIIKGEELSFKMPDIPVTVMDDFYMTLQLISLGYPNAVSFFWAQGQPGSDTPGGASTYRDLEMQKQNALKLAELFPGFVRPTEKETKTSWGANERGAPVTRTDVTVYWKKCLGSRAHLSKIPSTEEPTTPETPGPV